MHVPVKQSVLVMALDDKVWLDSDSLISYFRAVEMQARAHFEDAQRESDEQKAIAAFSSQDLIRQIADGLVLTTMVAAETVRDRRESRR
jgi:hypothetical protein